MVRAVLRRGTVRRREEEEEEEEEVMVMGGHTQFAEENRGIRCTTPMFLC